MKLIPQAVLALALAGCMQREVKDDAAASSSNETFAQQVEVGAKAYAQNCSRCHGDQGEGTKKGPAVVGLDRGALPLNPPPDAKWRKTQFRTVADLARFTIEKMPPKEAGSLPEDAYFRILAFDLKANGIDLGDKRLDMQLAETLEIPRPQTTQPTSAR